MLTKDSTARRKVVCNLSCDDGTKQQLLIAFARICPAFGQAMVLGILFCPNRIPGNGQTFRDRTIRRTRPLFIGHPPAKLGRENRLLFLRTFRALRDLRRYVPVVIVQNADR
jgi:hypothetical protein